MSEPLPLPPHPNLEQYKKLAKDFQRACKSGDSSAVRVWAERWAENRQEVRRMEERWLELDKTRCPLADAQFFIARSYGFASWPKFAKHVQAMGRDSSTVSKFEAAVEAIVSGEAATLQRLLRENPELVRERSTRQHRSTLLHYVSANGVEGFRQKTPKNIVAIAKILLDAGADVNAESDAYHGRSTALYLTATSSPPEEAGEQLSLMQLLLDRGARMERPEENVVNDCLHNGRGAAAKFLADRGAKLDLEGAAGVGRLDLVEKFFSEGGATELQLRDGFTWACAFGHTEVVEFLLQQGMDVQTGLHWAAYGAHLETIKLLLGRQVPVGMKEPTYEGTPLGWAVYAWATASEARNHDRHYAVVRMLVAAGATVDREWIEERPRVALKIKSDSHMRDALGLSE